MAYKDVLQSHRIVGPSLERGQRCFVNWDKPLALEAAKLREILEESFQRGAKLVFRLADRGGVTEFGLGIGAEAGDSCFQIGHFHGHPVCFVLIMRTANCRTVREVDMIPRSKYPTSGFGEHTVFLDQENSARRFRPSLFGQEEFGEVRSPESLKGRRPPRCATIAVLVPGGPGSEARRRESGSEARSDCRPRAPWGAETGGGFRGRSEGCGCHIRLWCYRRGGGWA